jgi:hypothetical protein
LQETHAVGLWERRFFGRRPPLPIGRLNSGT